MCAGNSHSQVRKRVV